MNKAEEINEALRKLATKRNTADRVQVLKDHDTPMLRMLMNYSYNPYIRFGMTFSTREKYDFRSMSVTGGGGGLDLDEPDIWTFIQYCRDSTDSSNNKKAQLAALCRRLNYQTAEIVLDTLEKNLSKGLGVPAINKAWPDFIATFSVQLANKYTNRKLKTFPAYVETKYDGMRAVGVVTGADVQVLSRTGRDVPAAAYFHKELIEAAKLAMEYFARVGIKASGVVFDGELIGETFKESMHLFRSGTVAKSGTFQIFEALPLEALSDGTWVSPSYETRQLWLHAALGSRAWTTLGKSQAYKVNSHEEIWSLYTKARSANLEGIIVKPANGLWQRKRSNDWLKVKAEETADLRIIGAFEGEGEMVGTLGGLIVEVPHKASFVECRVGSGFTHKDRATIWSMFLGDLEKISNNEDDYQLVGALAEVQYQEITPDGSLRHPVYIQLRLDKDEVSF